MKLIIYIILYTLLNVYIIIRMLTWITNISKKLNKKYIKITLVVIYTMCFITPIIGYLLPLSEFQKGIQKFANTFMGILIYMLMITLVADILRLILFKALKLHENKPKMKQYFHIIGVISIILVCGTAIYGLIDVGHIKVKNYNVSIHKSMENKNLKIALIADLHLGYNIGYKMMEQMIKKINNQDVDLVLIAGDVFDNSSETVDNIEKCQQAFSNLKSKYGSYAVFGNHDVDERLFCGFSVQGEEDYRNKKMEDVITSAGIKILDDETTLINDSIYLIGRKDNEKSGFGLEKRKDLPALLENVDKTKPVIVLEHEPVELEQVSNLGVDLHLAGHTHAGQFFPVTIFTNLKWYNNYGLKQVGNMSSIVTSGIGVYGPNIRIGTDSEVSIVNVQFE